MPAWRGRFDYRSLEWSGRISATDEATAGVKGANGALRSDLVINSKLSVPSGTYFATYKEAPDMNGDVQSGHDLDYKKSLYGDMSRAVPAEHLPKHERKMKSRDEHIIDTREADDELTDFQSVGVLHQHPDGGQQRRVPKVIPEKNRDGYVAMLQKQPRPESDIRTARERYIPKFSYSSGRAERAAKIVNNQVAKRLKKHAVDDRNKKIDDLNAVDLGD